MMAIKKVAKDIIFIYILMVHLKFVCYKGIKTGKKLYDLDFQNVEDSYE